MSEQQRRARPKPPQKQTAELDLGNSFGSGRWIAGRGGEDSFQDTLGKRVELITSELDEWSAESRAASEAIRSGLASSNCSEIHGTGPDQLFAKFAGSRQKIRAQFTSDRDYNAFVKSMIDEAESVHGWEEIRENFGGVLRMSDGSSLTIVLPPLSPTINFTIRKHNLSTWSAEDLIENGTMTEPMMRFLQASVAARANILVVGYMGVGKTSVLSLLTQSFGNDERIAIIEEIPEIWIQKPQVSEYTYQPLTPKLSLHDILDRALYMRFDRVIVGEVHMLGLAKMLEVMMYSDGSMSTYHSASVEQAVERMKIGLQLENPQMTSETALSMIRNAIDLVVVLNRVNGRHRCVQIAELDWRIGGQPGQLARTLLWEYDFRQGRHIVRNKLDEGGRIAEKALRWGVHIDPAWFIDHDAMQKLGVGPRR